MGRADSLHNLRQKHTLVLWRNLLTREIRIEQRSLKPSFCMYLAHDESLDRI